MKKRSPEPPEAPYGASGGSAVPLVESTPQRGAPRPPLCGSSHPRRARGGARSPAASVGILPLRGKFSLSSPPDAPHGASGGSDVPCPNRLRKGGRLVPLCGSSHPPRSRRGACSPAASVGILPQRGKFSLFTRPVNRKNARQLSRCRASFYVLIKKPFFGSLENLL